MLFDEASLTLEARRECRLANLGRKPHKPATTATSWSTDAGLYAGWKIWLRRHLKPGRTSAPERMSVDRVSASMLAGR